MKQKMRTLLSRFISSPYTFHTDFFRYYNRELSKNVYSATVHLKFKKGGFLIEVTSANDHLLFIVKKKGNPFNDNDFQWLRDNLNIDGSHQGNLKSTGLEASPVFRAGSRQNIQEMFINESMNYNTGMPYYSIKLKQKMEYGFTEQFSKLGLMTTFDEILNHCNIKVSEDMIEFLIRYTVHLFKRTKKAKKYLEAINIDKYIIEKEDGTKELIEEDFVDYIELNFSN
tara:strand:+ start:2255 stop:2935 length:681 start_codon:yes stop_codon:yes gene_type:complete